VSEIQELKLHPILVEETQSILYKAVPPTESWVDPNNDELSVLWYEAKITTNKADELLKENIDLEFGEEVSWTPKMLISTNIIEELVLPACEMIKQMDGVGFHNNNNIVVPAQSTYSAPNQSKKEDKPYFWW
jgi:hypothetical protein